MAEEKTNLVRELDGYTVVDYALRHCRDMKTTNSILDYLDGLRLRLRDDKFYELEKLGL